MEITFDGLHADALGQGIHVDAMLAYKDDVPAGPVQYSDDVVHNVYSVSKSFLATALGIALGEGLLSFTDRPAELFRGMMPADADPRWEQVTLKHLMTMNSGHGRPYLMRAERDRLGKDTDYLTHAFSCPMDHDPGTGFGYGNLAPYVAGRMLEERAGCTVRDYLFEKFWFPSGMREKPRWDTDSAGHTFPASDLYLDITEMAKLGLLYLHDGVYQGRRYLQESFVREATGVQTASSVINPTGHAPDEEQGYGYFFWRCTHPESFRAYGREGQFVVVLPREQAVLAIQSDHSDCQGVLDLLWKHLLPQL